MSKKFMPELSYEERFLMMRDNCESIEETSYMKQLTNDELDIKREQLADNSIKLFDMEDELKTIKAGFSKRMEPLKNENKLVLNQIKTKQEEVSGTLFHIANHDDGMMETFDENGELISSRRLRPDERQQRLFPIKKIG